jgi:DNA-directed RNA polymerase subunit RPC12/RpoP
VATIEYVCPSCRQVVSASQGAAGKTLPCPHCDAKAVVPTSAGGETNERLDFTAPEQGPLLRSGTSRRTGRRLSAIRIVVWAVFLIGVLVNWLLRLATALVSTSAAGERPDEYLNRVAGMLTWFMVFFALDRMLTTE